MQGLLNSEGDLHRRQRKIIAPSFQPHQIASYAKTMVNYSEQIQQRWRDGEMIEIGDEMTALTMSVVGKVLFDADIFTETDELGAAMAEIIAFANYGVSHLFPLSFSWSARRALRLLDTRIQQMIVERRISPYKCNDFLSTLLNAREEDGSPMNDKQVRDEALTLFGAGYETTVTALTWTWYLLATHPEVYQKLYKEVDIVLQGRSPTYADLPHLPYTLQVFKEAIRLYPPAYSLFRVALRDLVINGYPIYKQQIVCIAIYAIHQHATYFPEPAEFRPERFVPENEKHLPRFAYMPFGAGLRVCIGNHFALMEGHLLLATLTQRVCFKLVPGQHIEPDPSKTITLRPKYGMKMIVRRRRS